MIRRHEAAAAPAASPDIAPEALGPDAAGVCRGAPRTGPIPAAPGRTPRSCDICGHELLDEELTCPPCWLREGQGKTGFLRAIFASVTAMLGR